MDGDGGRGKGRRGRKAGGQTGKQTVIGRQVDTNNQVDAEEIGRDMDQERGEGAGRDDENKCKVFGIISSRDRPERRCKTKSAP